MIEFTCKHCGKVGRDYPSNKRQFCDRACYVPYWVSNVSRHRWGTGRVQYRCLACNAEFEDTAWERRKYCSVACSKKHTLFTIGRLAGENNPHWKGGRYQNEDGYWYVQTPGHPNAINGGYVAEHRLVMEKVLRRLLLPTEIVHHRDGDRTNNRPHNLEVMTRAEHIEIHRHELKGGEVT